MSNVIKGKALILDTFKSQSQLFPLWKLLDISNTTQMISNNFTNPDKQASLQLLSEQLDTLTPDNVYVLWLYRWIDKRKGTQAFSKPNATFPFQMMVEETVSGCEEIQVPVQGTQPVSMPSYQNKPYTPPSPHSPPPTYYQPPASPYGVNPSQQIGLSDHITLITQKAQAESNCEYLKNVVSDQAKTISQLERENRELQETIGELEEELDEIESSLNEEKEKENEGIKGTEEEGINFEKAISSLIKEHGGTIVENVFSKGVKGAPSFEETDTATVNGISEKGIDSYTLPELNAEMMAINSKWKKHLYKMLLIAEQKPVTFKAFMLKLELF